MCRLIADGLGSPQACKQLLAIRNGSQVYLAYERLFMSLAGIVRIHRR